MGRAQKSSGFRAGLVGINLTTAAHLVDALRRAADELVARAAETRTAATAADLSPGPPVHLEEIAAWARAEARTLSEVIERVRRADAPGVTCWTGGGHHAFAEPRVAFGRAERIVAALAGGRLGAARFLLERYGDDPVVATVVIDELGATGLVRLLHQATVNWAGRDPIAGDRRAVVHLVGEALARAGRHGTSTVPMGALVERAGALEAPLASLGLLFVGGARHPTEVVREAVVRVVAPLNVRTREQPGGMPWLIPARGAPLDARVLVLRAAARDPQAAREAIGAVDLDDLLPAAHAYLDGGAALAAVLRAATAPRDHHGELLDRPVTTVDRVVVGGAADNTRRVVEWIGAHRDVPPVVHLALGDLARPWIGSFRTAGLEDLARPVVLDEELARSFLAYAGAREATGETLRDAAWSWAAAEIRHASGTAFDGRGFAAVGSVLGIVTAAGLDADAARAEAADARAARGASLWQRATTLVLEQLPAPVRRAVDPLARRALRRAGAGGHLLTHWRDERDAAVVHEYLALEYLTASALWARRADNGYLRRVPVDLLVDPRRPDRGLRAPVTLDEEGVLTWRAWRSRLAARGPAPLQAAGEQFLLDTRR